jgi:uncharacterized protein YjiS (DUF1127 family)
MSAILDVTEVTTRPDGPPGFTLQRLLSACATPLRLLARRQERRQATAELSVLSDRELSDIGLVRSDIERVVHVHCGGAWR